MVYKIIDKTEWGKLATFIPNKTEPVYNWFYYKEGFSKELVFNLIRMFNLKKGSWVLDPFCGVGTTLLACKQLGINSMGFDTHPVSVFVTQVKLTDYDINKLKEEAKNLLSERFQKPEYQIKDTLIKKSFSRHTLDDIFFFRERILRIKDEKIRDFFTLALMNVAMKCSYVYKDGAVLKIKKKPVPPLRDMLRRQLKKMIKDLKGFHKENVQSVVDFGDARRLECKDEFFDSVITSPPYLNKIEYTRIYEIEQKLFLAHIETKPSIRSYIGVNLKTIEKGVEKLLPILGNDINKLPGEAIPYFSDMFDAIKEIYRVSKSGAKTGLIVGNGCFPTGVVESDIILCRLAEHVGFKVKKFLVLNKRWCTRHRTEKIGIMRESLLIWEK